MPKAYPLSPEQIGVAEHVVAEAIFGEDVRDEVAFISQPVVS